ncbi:MAG: pyruvate dehydrogenase (acetyl-transferring) E1 component subunit alpha [Gammaproteobacteria bacterium]|nr:pyruvate dehydrogenase (acetyl-transferring) E1 component subunit alpha [Gammaproteobacteria bacterium]MDH3466231.1 pyruvate dehydrogenase (acetyl-transferring) E1 component subunit alpha [Gammaproteobacteria bacterium]
MTVSFKFDSLQYLDTDGAVVFEPLPEWANDAAILIPLYRTMVETRAFDAKAVALQRTGQLGTYASSLGQEAIGVATASVMTADDVLLPTYREYGAQFWRGTTMAEILLYWGGDERGSDYAGPRGDFPISVPIATHACHAVGVAYAMKLRQQPHAAVCFVGDGATSKGDFYEAINAAGVWRLPVVFVVTNNQWAISVPVSKQTAAETLAHKSVAAGIAGRRVDGNDCLAMKQAATEAIDNARNGRGPTLLEALTYRMSDHTTADDASRYRSAEEVDAHRLQDPIDRLRRYMESRGLWADAEEQELHDATAQRVEQQVKVYLDTPAPAPQTMFDHLYATLPRAFDAQRQAVIEEK